MRSECLPDAAARLDPNDASQAYRIILYLRCIVVPAFRIGIPVMTELQVDPEALDFLGWRSGVMQLSRIIGSTYGSSVWRVGPVVLRVGALRR